MEKMILGFIFSALSIFAQAQPTGYIYGIAWTGPTANQLRFITTGPNISVYNDIFDAIPGDWAVNFGNPGYIANKPDLSIYALSSATTASLSLKADASYVNTALSGKYATPTCATTQYLRGDGSCATFPTIPAAQVQSDWNASSGLGVILNKPTIPASGPTINRARVATASDGTYTWNYATACPAGTVPIIQITPEGSSTITYNTVITAPPTNTSVSIKVTQVSDIVILTTIHVLGVQPSTSVIVHLTAICP